MKQDLQKFLGNVEARNAHIGDQNFHAYLRREPYHDLGGVTGVVFERTRVSILVFDSLEATPPGQGHLQRFLKLLASQDLFEFDFVMCANIANEKLLQHFRSKGWPQHALYPDSAILSVQKFVEMYHG